MMVSKKEFLKSVSNAIFAKKKNIEFGVLKISYY